MLYTIAVLLVVLWLLGLVSSYTVNGLHPRSPRGRHHHRPPARYQWSSRPLTFASSAMNKTPILALLVLWEAEQNTGLEERRDPDVEVAGRTTTAALRREKRR